jgi:dynein light chain roadblock-type
VNAEAAVVRSTY